MESKKDAFSIELQQYCLSQPVAVIRGLAGALKLGKECVIENSQLKKNFIVNFSKEVASGLYVSQGTKFSLLLQI